MTGDENWQYKKQQKVLSAEDVHEVFLRKYIP